jgi:GAF domain-containing protein
MGATLGIPMTARGALAGFLLLGPKRDQERFSPPEREALLTLASLAARALQQAELTRRIQELEQERQALQERLQRPAPCLSNGQPIRR